MEILDSYQQPVQQDLKFAGFWRRCLALIIDMILILISGLIISSSIAIVRGLAARAGIIQIPNDNGEYFLPIVIWVYSSVFVLYFVLMDCSSFQGTPGKIVVRIRVGKRDGGRISLINSAGRYLARFLSGILGLGFLMVFVDKKRQALHDKLAKTYVFYSNPKPTMSDH